MFPGYSRQFYRPNQQAISRALEKSKRNELTAEDILDEEDLVNDLKSQSFSQLIPCISKDKLKKFIDYISNEPQNENDHKSSYKFPYFASEILASENVFIIDKFFEEDEEISSRKSDESDKDEMKTKCRKSSIIEINMVDDSNTINENPNRDNTNYTGNTINEPTSESTKDNKLLDFFSNDEDNEHKTNENKDSNLENIVPDINENLKGEIIKDKEEKEEKEEENNNVNDINQSKSSVQEEKKKVYSTLDYLFNFLSNKEPLNFVLCGYFQKVFNHLANYKNACLMRYLLEVRPDVVFNMINHLDRKSISDCLFKILISYVPDFNDHEVKKETLMRIFKSYNSEEPERSSCISDLMNDILGNRRVYYLIVKNEDLLINLHQMIITNIGKHHVSRDLIRILVKFNENLLKDVNGIATSSNSNSNTESQFIFSNYLLNNMNQGEDETSLVRSHSNDNFDICNFTYVFVTVSQTVLAVAEDFVNESDDIYLENTYNQKKKILGLRRITEFEYIYNILEIIINANSNVSLSQNKNLVSLTDNLISSKIFKKIIQFFFDFPLNNFYQKIFNEMFVLVANKYTPEIIIFVCEDFLNRAIDYILDSQNLLYFGQGRSINSGIFAIICELTVFLSEVENQSIKQIFQENNRMKEFLPFFAVQIKDKYNKGIQFPQENPFHAKQISLDKSTDSTDKANTDSYRIIIEKCTENLSFVQRKRKNHFEENSLKEASEEETGKTEDNSYYDNNYWNMKPLDVALDEIK